MKVTLGSSLPFGVGVALLVLGTADTADAHVCTESPLSRVGPECTARSPQKIGPCGIEGRSQYVSTFRPGETITVTLNETVNHPSHYRISFNPDGDTFHDPVSVDDKSGDHPFVLLDGIEDEEEARQSVEITFPDVECENCTLQVIQVMYDKQGNGFGGRNADGGNDDIYYSCADIVLTRDSATGAASEAGTVGDRHASVEVDGSHAEDGSESGSPGAFPPLERFVPGRSTGVTAGARGRRVAGR
jgi:hypothetical protein